MPRTWVKVEGPANRDVFVNGNFTEPAGATLVPFRVEIGQNSFFLLRPDSTIEAERTQDCPSKPRTDPVIVPLAPVTVIARVAAFAPARAPVKKAAKRRAPARPRAKAKRRGARGTR